MNEETLDRLLVSRARVRVWDAHHSSVFVTGDVIAYHMGPMICVRDNNGIRHWHSANLPIDEVDIPKCVLDGDGVMCIVEDEDHRQRYHGGRPVPGAWIKAERERQR